MNAWRAAAVCLVACGARTGLDVPTPGPPLDGSVEDHHVVIDAASDVGDGTTADVADVSVPVPDAGQPVPMIAAATFACALNAAGVVKCWQKFAQATAMPLPVIVEVAVGAHAFARAQDDSLWVWGTGGSCSLGNGVTQLQTIPSPLHLTSLGNKFAAISTNENSSLALLTDGSVVAWGFGPNGTGGGSTLCSPTPLVGFSGPVVKISQGEQNGCAVLDDQRVQCWGINAYGTLGNGSADIASTVASPVTGLTDAVDVSVSYTHACAVRSGGGVVCWGDDIWGELGDGQTNDGSTTPVDVIGLAGPATSVTSNVTNTCAKLASGAVQCWGGNGSSSNNGSVGNGGTPADVLSPTTILTSNAIGLSEQMGLGCVLLDDGSAKCWGDWDPLDDAGSPSPIAVQGLP